jgi:hypothetical protein
MGNGEGGGSGTPRTNGDEGLDSRDEAPRRDVLDGESALVGLRRQRRTVSPDTTGTVGSGYSPKGHRESLKPKSQRERRRSLEKW